MSSKIEDKITEIEDFLADCKFQALSNSKIIVNKDEMEELLGELKNMIPGEVRQYQKVIANKDAILQDAQSKADAIVAEANVQKESLLSEHQIMQQAYAQANEIIRVATNEAREKLDKATNEANYIRGSAMTYTDDMLKMMESILAQSVDAAKTRYGALVNDLQSCLDTVVSNRNELSNSAISANDGVSGNDIDVL